MLFEATKFALSFPIGVSYLPDFPFFVFTLGDKLFIPIVGIQKAEQSQLTYYWTITIYLL